MTHAAHPQHFHPGGPTTAQVRFASGVNFIAGVYLVISSWIGGVNAGNHWNSTIAGLVVLILAATRFGGSTGAWASWVDALIGIWLIISPWVYGYAGQGWMWNTIVVGIVVAVLGAWSALASNASDDHPSTSTGM